MAGYYDQLEAQLAELTQRGVPRRRLAFGRIGPRIRVDLLAVAASLLVVVVVGAAFLSAGGTRRSPSHAAGGGKGLAVIRNFAPGPAPGPSGSLVCDSDLAPSGTRAPAVGEVRVYDRPPTRYEISITASRLDPNVGGDVYAVWLLPATRTTLGSYRLIGADQSEFVGLISPSVGREGTLAAEGLLPPDANGAYQVRITLEPSASARTPGRTVLEGFIEF